MSAGAAMASDGGGALENRLAAPGPKRILALDGGGVRGLISLAFLERIEAILKARAAQPAFRLADYFDLVGGASTGSVIATGLALGRSVGELIDLYLNLSHKGFRRRGWFGGALAPKFDSRALEAAIRSEIGDITLGSPALRSGLGIVAKRLDTGSLWLFHNHPRGRYFGPAPGDADAIPNRDLALATLIRASTAAPSYFAPEMIEVARGSSGAFVDGAVSAHGNPALLMLMLATLEGYGFRWRLGANRMMVVSVGAGIAPATPTPAAIARMSGLQLALTALKSVMDDASWLNQTLLQWLGETPTPWRIDSEIGDLAGDRLSDAKLLFYLRYDTGLGREDLERYGQTGVTNAVLAALTAFDQPDMAPRLLDLGRRAAEHQVKAEHFPEIFAP